MDYQKAIRLAKKGKEEGFLFLYNQTYKSKYYLALQYMKNEEAAKDVLQEAYIKAFSRLDMLERPEAFPGWLGTIVGNTAKNMLQRKNPMLFSDIECNGDNEFFEYKMEDMNLNHQPELFYTQQETQALVHEMIDALSEEQRICILMYEIEGIPIKEIALSLNCSENTVKSRLNYGRKNLKAQAEKLQRKGYRLYGIAPIPFLLALLYSDIECHAASPAFFEGKALLAQRLHLSPETAATSAAGATSTVSTAVKTGFIHTVTGKLAVTAAVLFIVCAGTYYSIYRVYTQDMVPKEKNIVLQDNSSSFQSPEQTVETSAPNENTQSILEIYEEVLQSIQNEEDGYGFLSDFQLTGNISYFLYDMDGDGIPELITGAECLIDAFYGMNLKVYSCRQEGNGYVLKNIDSQQLSMNLYANPDGNGLLAAEVYRMPGDMDLYLISIQNDTLVKAKEPAYHFKVGDTTIVDFTNSNPLPPWTDISSYDGLRLLN